MKPYLKAKEQTNKEEKKVFTEKPSLQSMTSLVLRAGALWGFRKEGVNHAEAWLLYRGDRDTPFSSWEGQPSSDAPGLKQHPSALPWPTFLSHFHLFSAKPKLQTMRHQKNQIPILWKPLPFTSIYQEMFLSKNKQHLTLPFLAPGEFRPLSKAEPPKPDFHYLSQG